MMYDEIKCPYCGHIQDEDKFIDYLRDCEMYESGDIDTECEKCGGTFNVDVEIEYEPRYGIGEITEYKEERERLKTIKDKKC